MMKKTLSCFRKTMLCLCLVIYASVLKAQDVHLDWVRQVGGSCWNGDEDDITHSVATDSSGNVYAAGYFCGTVDFDPGPGTAFISSTGTSYPDLFLYKLSPAGNLVWVKIIATNVGSWTKLAIAVDPGGNVVSTGSFVDEVDFDPGPDSFKLSTSAIGPGAINAFILKLDAQGNFVWAKSIGESNGNSVNGIGVVLDTAGNVFTTGQFMGTADFNTGTGPADTLFMETQGSYDVYVSKLNASGDFIWARKFGSTEEDVPASIATDAWGNLYTSGKFKGTVDFDPGAGTFNLSATGYYDAFISKLDNSGNFVWARAFLADATLDQYNNVNATGICTDAPGNVYIKGAFGGTVDFDPGPATNNLVTASANTTAIFVTKLDSGGNFIWAKKISGGWGVGFDGAIATDSAHNLYLTGDFSGTSDFDPGTGVFDLTSANLDIYVCKLTSGGDFVWAKKLGGTAYDRGYDIAVDPSGKNIYTVGSFAGISGGQADFDPGTGNLILSSAGNSDGFIHKMTCNTYNTSVITACDSFAVNGVTYTQSGFYVTQIVPNATGCDSIFAVDLTLTHSSSNTRQETACDSFSFNGHTYTASGIYLLETLINAAGCDSLLLLDLTVNHVNTAVVQTSNVLSAAAAGAAYQWLNCDNGYSVIAGATQQTYTPASNGSYAVIVTQAGCSDTSACYTVTGTGIDLRTPAGFIKVYPNPAKGILTISGTEALYDARVKLINIIGQVVLQRYDLKGQHLQIDLSPYPAGTYILEVEVRDGLFRSKILKD